MALLPETGIIDANGDFDVVLPARRNDVIIAGDTSGANNGFDGGNITVKAVHPLDGTAAVPGVTLDAPVPPAIAITSDFTDLYKGQKGQRLRFTAAGLGGNAKIRVHVGAEAGG